MGYKTPGQDRRARESLLLFARDAPGRLPWEEGGGYERPTSGRDVAGQGRMSRTTRIGLLSAVSVRAQGREGSTRRARQEHLRLLLRTAGMAALRQSDQWAGPPPT